MAEHTRTWSNLFNYIHKASFKDPLLIIKRLL